MDCEKLRKDIERLKKLRDDYVVKKDAAIESGKGKIALGQAERELSVATDEILESYLQEFAEKNPEIAELDLGERIEGFEDCKGDMTYISSIAPLPDGSMMIGGGGGALYHATWRNGKLDLGERIEGFKGYEEDEDTGVNSIITLSDGSLMIGGDMGALYHATWGGDELNLGARVEGFEDNRVDITSIVQLSDGSIVIGGCEEFREGGAIYHATWQRNGKLALGRRIDGVTDDVHYQGVFAISSLSDNSIVVGGYDGELYHATWKNGRLDLGKRIEGFKGCYGRKACVNVTSVLSDGSLMIGGDDGALYHATWKDGRLDLGKRIEGFKDYEEDEDAEVSSITMLPDGSLIIGGWYGTLYHATWQNGKLNLGRRIEGLEGSEENLNDISSVVALPDGGVMIGGMGGLLHYAKIMPVDVDTLKQNLSIIVAKREEK